MTALLVVPGAFWQWKQKVSAYLHRRWRPGVAGPRFVLPMEQLATFTIVYLSSIPISPAQR
ncbi:MAG: hypothetical protein NZ959_10090 [Armatimonadetes bacterium]|nr:hypothetical protein [Armatimonadota bacterium]MDW8122609.1 hypothetical protein [Armatimonadota bacterium]